MFTQNFNVPVTIATKKVPVADNTTLWTYQLIIFGNTFASGLELHKTEAAAIRAAQQEIRETANTMKEHLQLAS